VFTARYALSPYIKQIRFVFKGLNSVSLGTHFPLSSCIVVEFIVIVVIRLSRFRTPMEMSCTPKYNFLFRCVRVNIEKLLFASSCLSVRPSACVSAAPTGRIFVNFDIAHFDNNLLTNWKFG
jgi:hypothetical protein